MPLFTITEPSRMDAFIKTFLEIYKNGGRLPHWEIWGEYSGSMIGHHSLPIILDAYNKGIRNYDVPLAYQAMKNQVEHDGYYSNLGFIPADKTGGSVSIVMEFAYDDWCLAEMAKNPGKEKDYLYYRKRAQFYRNMFDASTGFMRPKNSDRTWVTPFDPAEGSSHFVEGNAFQYSLFAPQDINGLITLIGGDKKFNTWLDNLFSYKSKYDDEVIDASGLIGQYAHGNEPSHHMAYLYNYVGEAHKTQKIVREILETMYDDKPDGLKGNEDCGQMSAWYILSSMGFYPVTPGIPSYIIGTPVFDKVTIHLENGKKFVIEAKNVSAENFYIRSATLNGKPYAKSWFKHSDIVNGGKFIFQMSDAPDPTWGSAQDSRPFTEPLEPYVSIPYAITSDEYFLHTGKAELKCDDKEAEIHFTLDGSEPAESSTLYRRPVTVNKTTVIRFAAFKDGVLPSPPVSLSMNKLEFVKYTNYENKYEFEPGLEYKYYHAHVMDEFQLDKLEPLETGIISRITVDERKREDYFGYQFEGFLEFPKDGIYTISISTNDGSTFFLDGKAFLKGGSKSIAIRKGKYKILQKYFQLGNKKYDHVFREGPGIEKQEIPPDAFFHRRNN